MKKILLILATICVVCACHKPTHDWNEFSYTVSQGETLWTIAEEYCPEDMDKRDYIDEIKKLNNIGDTVYEWQELTLLTTEKCIIDMYDVVDIQENDGWVTITLSDGNYYEWYKGEVL